LRGAQSADILLTTMWPSGITKGTHVPLGTENTPGPSSKEIAALCSALKARYHFSMSPGAYFWEREPFMYETKDQTEKQQFNVFISMRHYGYANKAIDISSFTLPRTDTSVERPPGTSASPFTSFDNAPKKRAHEGTYIRFQHGDRDHR